VVLGLLLLGACASQPPARPIPVEPEERGPVVVEDTRSPLEIALARADESSDLDVKARYLVQAATLLQDDGDVDGALDLLDNIDPSRIRPVRRAAVWLLQAELLQGKGESDRVLTLLRADRFPLGEVDEVALQRYHRQRALAFSAQERANDAVNE